MERVLFEASFELGSREGDCIRGRGGAWALKRVGPDVLRSPGTIALLLREMTFLAEFLVDVRDILALPGMGSLSLLCSTVRRCFGKSSTFSV